MNEKTASTYQAQKLTQVIERLKQLTTENDLTVGQFLHELSLNGHMFFCFVLSVPFLIPMPLPGISTPLGIAIAIAAVQIIFDKDPWLPSGWTTRPMSKQLALKILNTVMKVVQVTERFIKPRLKFFARHPGFVRFNGVILLILAILLALPMPPGFNAPPALAIILMSLGSLERDGIAIIISYILSVINFALFAAVFFLGVSGFQALIGLTG